jgi:hypothetical protein
VSDHARVRGRAGRPPAPWFAGALVLLASSRALALCPNCLAQQSTLTPTLKLLAVFLVVPFVVAAVVYAVVRRVVYGRPAPVPAASEAAPPSTPASLPPSSGGGAQAG